MLTIPQIQNLPDKSAVDSLQGKIVAVYTREPGPRPNSTRQNAVMADNAGNKIRMTVWDHPDLTELKGGEYVLHETRAGAKSGGVSVRHNNFNNKLTPEPQTLSDATGMTGPRSSVELQHSRPPQNDGAQRLSAIARLWVACYHEALSLNLKLSPDQFQSCVSSLYIQACRDNISIPLPEVKPEVPVKAQAQAPDDEIPF